MFWSTLLFTAEMTLPICVILMIGITLKRLQFIDDNFVHTSSQLVFTLCMPALLFTSLASLDLNTVLNLKLVTFALVASAGAFVTAWLLSYSTLDNADDRGVFIQGSARPNLAIVGLALAGNLYGDEGIALMSLMLAFLVPLYNITSVFVLSYFNKNKGGVAFSWSGFFGDLLRNPLMIAVISGAAVAVSGWEIPQVADKVGRYFAQISLPLALISIGGSLSLKSLFETSRSSVWAGLHKICFMPLLVVPLAWFMGFREMELGLLFLAFTCPTAAASFVMCKGMGGNATLAANIIVLTTIGSLPATAVGIFALRFMSLI